MSINELLDLPVMYSNMLNNMNITTVRELVSKDSPVVNNRHIKERRINDLNRVLSEFGLRLGMTDEEVSRFEAAWK